MRADVVVKLDMTANRSAAAKEKIKNNYAGVLPKVDTGGRSVGKLGGA